MLTSSSFVHIFTQVWVYFCVIGLGVIAFLTYYVFKVVEKPIFICKNPKLRNFFATNMPVLAERYWPTVWCFQGQLQTFVQGVLNLMNFVSVNYRREIIRTPDGGEISLDWADNDERSPFEIGKRPTVIILPGLAGSSSEFYIKCMVKAALDLGYRAVVFNNRGLGQSKLRTPRTFAMANSDDTRTVVSHVKAKYPLSPLIAEGFSAGAVTLFHYLEHYGEDCHLLGAMLVSVLFNGFDSTRSIETFPNVALFNKFLTKHLLEGVVIPNLTSLRQSEELDIESILKSRTIRQYHTRLTTPMFGYKDWKHFYSECSIDGRMHKIKVPTLILNAGDDPFTPLDSIPIEEIKRQDNVILLLLSHGGHNAFLRGLIPTGRSFDVEVFSQFIAAVFRKTDFNRFYKDNIS